MESQELGCCDFTFDGNKSSAASVDTVYVMEDEPFRLLWRSKHSDQAPLPMKAIRKSSLRYQSPRESSEITLRNQSKPDEPMSRRISMQIQESPTNPPKNNKAPAISREDLILKEPSISTRFNQIVRKFNREQLRSTCQVMKGCKPQKAQQISDFVFKQVQAEISNLRLSLSQNAVTMPVSAFTRLLDFGFLQSEYSKPDVMKDFMVASMLMQSKINVIVLLAGTSGTGKSTLASLVGARFGIQTVLSTDSIRHVMRNYLSEKENPILFCSTYEAGAQVSVEDRADLSDSQITIKGYRQQSKLVQQELSKVIERASMRNESIVVEGVHLDVKYLQKVMAQYPSCIPFILHIKSKHKHGERFAVRAKHMTIDPKFNKYVSSLKQIRTIQDYLVKTSEEVLIPRIENHNVDRSVSLIQTTVMRCLHKIIQGDRLYDSGQKRATGIHDVVQTIQKNHLNSKQAQSFIKMKVDKAELMNQFFQTINGREGLDPEYQRHLEKHRPSTSHEAKARNLWGQIDQEPRSASIQNTFVEERLTKQEKKQIKKNLIGNRKETQVEPAEGGGEIPEDKKRESDAQRAMEVQKLEEAKIRIVKQEEIEKQKEMAVGIKAAAHEEQRKRNKSEDNAGQLQESERSEHNNKKTSEEAKSDHIMSDKDILEDPEVDYAFEPAKQPEILKKGLKFRKQLVKQKIRQPKHRNQSSTQQRLLTTSLGDPKARHKLSNEALENMSDDKVQHWDEEVNRMNDQELSNSDQSLSQIGSLVSYTINYMEKQNKIVRTSLGVLAETVSDSDDSLKVEKESKSSQSDPDTVEEEVDLSQSDNSEPEQPDLILGRQQSENSLQKQTI